MGVQEHISLKPFNSFGIDVKAAFYVAVHSVEEIKNALKNRAHPDIFILSGGSNMLLTKDLEAQVIHVCNKGITVISETEDHIVVEVAAGENWHDLVLWTLKENLGGIENLALIPGCVGAAPIQNIGAYGVELQDSFVQCAAIEISSLKETTLLKSDCDFAYRSSIFKTTAKGKYLIYNIQLRLTKAPHSIKTQYGDIANILKEQLGSIHKAGLRDVANAVISIRLSKLPDPKILGNSGSFFKNPILSKKAFKDFNNNWPHAPYYDLGAGLYKVPAGWLIEQAGLKGHRDGAVGVHEKQALVLVNYGGATGLELLELAQKIMNSVLEKFNIPLAPEVNIIPSQTTNF